MKKIMFLVVSVAMAVAVFFSGCALTETKTTETKTTETKTNETKTTETETSDNFLTISPARKLVRADGGIILSEGENLTYNDSISFYEFQNILFIREEKSLVMGLLELYELNPDDFYGLAVTLEGSNFTLTESEVWFVSSNRHLKIFSIFDYFYDLTDKDLSTYLKEKSNIDLHLVTANHFLDFAEIQNIVKVGEDTWAITSQNLNYTIVIAGNEISVYKYREILSEIALPFEFKEITKTSSCDPYTGSEYLTFKSDSDNVIGIVTFPPNGVVSYSIIDNDDAAKELVYDGVRSYSGWGIYKKNGDLIAGNGQLSFSIGQMEWKASWLEEEEIGTLIKGYTDIAFEYIKIRDYTEWLTSSTEELVRKYVR